MLLISFNLRSFRYTVFTTAQTSVMVFDNLFSAHSLAPGKATSSWLGCSRTRGHSVIQNTLSKTACENWAALNWMTVLRHK